MILLKANTKDTRKALEAATAGIVGRLAGEKRFGMYCCGTCSAALWRHIGVHQLAKPNSERLLAAGLKKLKSYRDGKGRWRVFPFYYTLLALSEIDSSASIREMQYAAPSLERLLKRSASGDKNQGRRRLLAERILARC